MDKTEIRETMTSEAPIGDWIKDFENSTDPKFEGDSKEDRRKRAIAAWYNFKKNKKKKENKK
jgi:hypothetical protein